MAVEKPIIIVYDAPEQSVDLGRATEIVQEQGLLTRTYYNAAMISEVLLNGTGIALLSGFSPMGAHISPILNQGIGFIDVLNAAATVDMPVVMLSRHPQADQHINPDKHDIVIPDQPHHEMEPELTKWLGMIRDLQTGPQA